MGESYPSKKAYEKAVDFYGDKIKDGAQMIQQQVAPRPQPKAEPVKKDLKEWVEQPTPAAEEPLVADIAKGIDWTQVLIVAVPAFFTLLGTVITVIVNVVIGKVRNAKSNK